MLPSTCNLAPVANEPEAADIITASFPASQTNKSVSESPSTLKSTSEPPSLIVTVSAEPSMNSALVSEVVYTRKSMFPEPSFTTTSSLPPSTLKASVVSVDTMKSESVAFELITTFEDAPGLIVTAVGIFANKLATDIFLFIGVPLGSSMT